MPAEKSNEQKKTHPSGNTTPTWDLRRVLLYGTIGVLTGWLVLHFLLPAVFPVLVGVGLGVWLRRWGKRLADYTAVGKIPALGEKGCGICLGVLFCLLLPLVLYRGAAVLTGQAGTLARQAAGLWRWDVLPDWLTAWVPVEIQTLVGQWTGTLVEKGAGWLAGIAGGILQALPGAALSVFIGILTLFYWLVDGEGICVSLLSLLPTPLRNTLRQHPWYSPVCTFLREGIHGVVLYLQAQMAIASVVFLVLTAGLRILSIPSPVAWAFLVSLVDLLPFLGASAVLVPWAIFAFLADRTVLGVGIVILAVLVWLLRQFLESRFLGRAMGVHAWVMLVGLFVAYRLAGVRGMLCCAVLLGAKRKGDGDKKSQMGIVSQ